MGKINRTTCFHSSWTISWDYHSLHLCEDLGIQVANHQDTQPDPATRVLARYDLDAWTLKIHWKPYPIGSMYAIYGNIYHQQKPQMLAYIPYMDPYGL